MPFTNPSFPGQIFSTVEEFEEARRKRAEIETNLAQRASIADDIVRVTATIIPAPKDLLERKVVSLERQVEEIRQKLSSIVSEEATHNREGLSIGTVLRGESRGEEYTLEVLEEGYLCSNGKIYDSLSGAALGVSENRRSGWKFWKDVAGIPVGEITGRFAKNASNNPFDSR